MIHYNLESSLLMLMKELRLNFFRFARCKNLERRERNFVKLNKQQTKFKQEKKATFVFIAGTCEISEIINPIFGYLLA